ncbi:MAG: SRPBCC domain-containing protein [Planctomycetota bacterium]
MNLPFAVDRTVLIRAQRATVFSFFTDSERFASWWGAGSTIDARVGGAVRICYPGSVVATGEVLALEPGRRIVFSYGYEGEGPPIAPGASRVTIELQDDPHGTVVALKHEVQDQATRDHHVQGWRYHLSVFAHVAGEREHMDPAAPRAPRMVDGWFAAWNEADDGRRRATLAACCADDVTFRDPWSALQGRDELLPHIGKALQIMPGLQLVRTGPVRHGQGTALCDWQLQQGEQVFAAGTNVFELRPDGRIQGVVGIRAPAAER